MDTGQGMLTLQQNPYVNINEKIWILKQNKGTSKFYSEINLALTIRIKSEIEEFMWEFH